ncbi:MAG: ATP-binding protein [Acetatifactor sp.]|nr:ATP-binding protein [Acetatifactor sp.]
MEIYVNVKNFGKIKEARVNISNFTIFVGNNNSGKTQLMELIYTIITQLSKTNPNLYIPQIDNIDAYRMDKEEIINLNKWVNQYLKDNIHGIIDDTFNASIPIEEVTIEFEDIDNGYEIFFLTDRTIDYLFKKELIPSEDLKNMILDRKNIYGEIKFYGAFVIKNSVEGKEQNEINMRFSESIPIDVALSMEVGYVLAWIIGGKSPVSSNVLFLPASRMGLMLLYKHYFGNTSQNKDEVIRDKNQNSKGITKPVLDFLTFLLNHSYSERVAKQNDKIISFIYENLIDGTISENGDATVYTPKDYDKEIPIFVASSMVNEIVPVVRALTSSDNVDYLFYDEVETSMHPLKQIEMVKLLNRLNNQGIKLLVSTHSDTMATKINNLLLLSQGDLDFEAAKTALEKNGIAIKKEDLLVSKNIHVYQFINDQQDKSIVQELEFQKVPSTGYNFNLFNDSTMNLFEEAKVVMGIDNEN